MIDNMGQRRWGLAAALASGLLLAVSRDTGHWGALVLVAPVPLLMHALTTRYGVSLFGLAFLAGLMGEAGPMVFYGKVLPLIYGIAVFQALLFALAILFLFALRARPWQAVLGFAAMTAGAEYLVSLVSPNGSFGALGYALVDVLPLLQFASLGGVPGLSFLAAVIPAGLAAALLHPRRLSVWLAGGVPAIGAIAYGLVMLSQPQGETIRIALLTNDLHAGWRYKRENAPAIAGAFADEIRAIAADRPAYAVIPEKMFVEGRDAQSVAPIFQTVANETGISVLVGYDQFSDGRQVNSARLYVPGKPVQTYLKRRMVPGLEREFVPGPGPLIVGKTGIAICKDMDFAAMIRGYGGVELLLAPAWDFTGDARLHGRMAVVRGVENGFALARSASEGLMTLSDANGRIIADQPSADGPRTLVGDLPAGPGRTLYSRIGDVFAWAMLGLWAVLAISLVRVFRAGSRTVNKD
jgi:apolipoprotein N-acyltransferase